MSADAMLSRPGVIRRAGSADAGAASVVELAPAGCAGCRCVRIAASRPFPVATALPDGTPVRVVVAARHLRREALLVFAPPIAAGAAAALWLPAGSGAAVALALLGGALAAAAARRLAPGDPPEVVRAVPDDTATPAPPSLA